MLVLHALFDRFRQISSNVETLCQFNVRARVLPRPSAYPTPVSEDAFSQTIPRDKGPRPCPPDSPDASSPWSVRQS
jgi:hypothetical protein